MAHQERTREEEVSYLRGMSRLARERGFGPLASHFAFEAECVAVWGSGWRARLDTRTVERQAAIVRRHLGIQQATRERAVA